MNEKINVEALQVGMFVAELDRPWLDTPFLLQGILIESDEQIETLRRYCHYVMVDPLRSIGWSYRDNTPEHQEALRRVAILERQEPGTSVRLAPLPLDLAERTSSPFARNQNRYLDRAYLEEELPRAKEIHLHAEQAVQQLFDELQRHPVPLQEAAIRALSNNSMALDIYCWLTYRLRSLKDSTTITWAALMPQFGVAFKDKKDFRRRFNESLHLALAVYPEAKVEVVRGGLKMSRSAPSVPSKGDKSPRLSVS